MSEYNNDCALWRESFNFDKTEIECKMMSFQRSNDLIRSRLHKFASGIQSIQKRVCIGRNMSKSASKITKCPLAKSALIVAENLQKEVTKHMEKYPTIGTKWQYQLGRTSQDPHVTVATRRRSYSDNRQKKMIETDYFLSSVTKQGNTYGSNKSIDSIFRMHETLSAPSRSRSKSESSISKKQDPDGSIKKYNIYPNKESGQRAARPNYLFITNSNSYFHPNPEIKEMSTTAVANPIKHLEDYLVEYRNSSTNLESKKMRSEKAARAMDSCILLLSSLLED